MALNEIITVSTRPNLALVKYWGKRRLGEDCQDPALNLPQNSSFSITLDSGDMLLTKTSVVFSERFTEDNFYLDGKKQDMSDPELQERFIAINKLRDIAKTKAKVLVVSNNSFPTASGFASSASGLAALTYASAKALGISPSFGKLSEITRIGSGSACRSLLGGFVEWSRGTLPNGSDSIAKQILDENYWPELTAVIGITSREKKKVSSRAGMKQTVATSELYKQWPSTAEKHVKKIEEAAKKRDFNSMAEIIMSSAMMMHATMLDTRPPIIYLNNTSRDIIYAIEDLNASEKRTMAAYTFDAGPNAYLICLKNDVEKVIAKLNSVKGVEKIMTAKVGAGPKVLDTSESLIDPNTLKPKVKDKE